MQLFAYLPLQPSEEKCKRTSFFLKRGYKDKKAKQHDLKHA